MKTAFSKLDFFIPFLPYLFVRFWLNRFIYHMIDIFHCFIWDSVYIGTFDLFSVESIQKRLTNQSTRRGFVLELSDVLMWNFSEWSNSETISVRCCVVFVRFVGIRWSSVDINLLSSWNKIRLETSSVNARFWTACDSSARVS